MFSEPVDAGGEVLSSSVGCTIGMWDMAPLVLTIAVVRYIGLQGRKKMFFKAGVLRVRRAAGFSGVLIGAKSLFCFRSSACNFESYAAHRTPRLSAERAGVAEYASRAAVHVESSDTMRSRKAQCQAPPDNPATGYTYGVSQ